MRIGTFYSVRSRDRTQDNKPPPLELFHRTLDKVVLKG